MKKTLLSGLSVLLIMLALIGCSSNSNTPESSGNSADPESSAPASAPAEGEKLDPVTLKIILPGDRPADMDVIIEEAEKRMADTINVKLDLVFVPFSDLASKTQVMLASGEDVDLIFDAPWLHMEQMIAAGYYEPLEDLLAQYGQDAVSVRSQQMFDANKFQGKIYALPLGNSHLDGRTYLIRKDLREKYGVAPIKSYEELIAFANKIKENEKDIIPLLASGQPGQKDISWGAFRAFMTRDPEILRSDALGQSLVLHYKNNDGKVYNLFDEMDPTVWSWIEDARKLYTDGLIHPDVLAIKDANAVFESGDVAIYATNGFGVPAAMKASIPKNVPGAEVEAVTFMPLEKGKITTSFKQANFQAIPKVSKNKERAMMFLNWTAQKENYDLLAYGIEGTNYEAIGDDQYKTLPDSKYSYFPYAWVWNPTLDRLDAGLDPDAIEHLKFNTVADNLIASKLTGFSFNPEPVANEVSLYSAIEDKYYSSLFNGVSDPTETWNKLKSEGEAYLKKIQVELQKQIDEFLATK
ncbi:ABC transporter substrate-binding protein [Cohnella lupini]|uniref:Putative aldouronate transport system substrate-binding protein n=1 Tax=Cohnella lupini TaxID=1294267 RepID=A0A3D9ISR2_9BACL|nr:extracellular solute-binding protein [Cohnella lupini]RED64833.1 putative aldouronate transport system substrate-binding protein [Cohnella lupini]